MELWSTSPIPTVEQLEELYPWPLCWPLHFQPLSELVMIRTKLCKSHPMNSEVLGATFLRISTHSVSGRVAPLESIKWFPTAPAKVLLRLFSFLPVAPALQQRSSCLHKHPWSLSLWNLCLAGLPCFVYTTCWLLKHQGICITSKVLGVKGNFNFLLSWALHNMCFNKTERVKLLLVNANVQEN